MESNLRASGPLTLLVRLYTRNIGLPSKDDLAMWQNETESCGVYHHGHPILILLRVSFFIEAYLLYLALTDKVGNLNNECLILTELSNLQPVQPVTICLSMKEKLNSSLVVRLNEIGFLEKLSYLNTAFL